MVSGRRWKNDPLKEKNAPLPCDNPLENDETPLFSPRKSLHLCPIHPTEEKGGIHISAGNAAA
jgi:hypothetical protein